VWHLSYGSNMSPQVLSGRRRVWPQQSLPCYVPGYTLSFGVCGLPFAEPGFATIAPAAWPAQLSAQPADHTAWREALQGDGVTPCALHGVLHRVSRSDWRRIQVSEGVLGSGSSSGGGGVGYQVQEVECWLYDNVTAVKAVTLQAAAGSLHKAERAVQPSARYLRLLQEGARRRR
jgi:hypothetical protein